MQSPADKVDLCPILPRHMRLNPVPIDARLPQSKIDRATSGVAVSSAAGSPLGRRRFWPRLRPPASCRRLHLQGADDSGRDCGRPPLAAATCLSAAASECRASISVIGFLPDGEGAAVSIGMRSPCRSLHVLLSAVSISTTLQLGTPENLVILLV
jgi:hypothetical protein